SLRGVVPLLLVFLFLPPANALAGVNRWTTSGPQLGAINVLASNPDNPSLVYAGTDFDGIFRSVDGGANWTLSSNGLAAAGILALQIDPSSPSVLYAGTQNAGAFGSVDGGDNWEPRSFGLSGFASYVSGFAIDP